MAPARAGQGATTRESRRAASRVRRWRDRHRDKPRRFGDLPDGAWRRIAQRTFDHFRSKGVTNLAAALTYRSLLSLFPGLVALVAVLGVAGQYPQTYDAILAIVRRVAPATTVQTISGPVQSIITHKGGAGALLGIGLAGAIWAASGYIGALSWALNVIWEAERGRSWYRQWPFNIAVTVLVLVLGAAVMTGIVLTGGLASSVGTQLGLGAQAVTIWQIAKWPVMAVIVVNLVAFLYYVTPNVRPPSLRWITPGAVFALVAWAVLTGAFALYVANFASFGRTYGTLGAIITFLVWAWFTNIAILLGGQIDAEIERERELAAGIDAEEHIDLPLRQAD